MDRFSYQLVKGAVELFGARGPVWEVGAYRVEGQEKYGDLRELFGGEEYVGCDMREGPMVDRIEDVTRLTAGDGEVGTLICLNTLEHVRETWKGFSEIGRVVAEDGMMIVNFPFYFHRHDYPGDYWRITTEGMEEMTKGFGWRIVGSLGRENTPKSVFCVGWKRKPEGLEGKLEEYLEGLRQEGVERPGTWKRVKSRVGYHLFSKRGFRDIVHGGQVRGWVVVG